MPFERHDEPDGPRWVRLPYRAADYTVDQNTMRSLDNWRGDHLPFDALLELHDGPFAGWTEVARFERDGKAWIRMRVSDWYVDVEVVEFGLGETIPVDPATAYELAVASDEAAPRR
jgi:hypothetical protein